MRRIGSGYGPLIALAALGLIAVVGVTAVRLLRADAPEPTSPVVVQVPSTSPAGSTRRLKYVAVEGGLRVYDIDRDHRLVKTIVLPPTYSVSGARGLVAHAPTERLYLAYWGAPESEGRAHLLALDLRTDRVVWHRRFQPSLDSGAITPDGAKLFIPCGEEGSCDWWFVVDAATGEEIDRIHVHDGAHNTIVGLSGRWVYLASLKSDLLRVADTRTHEIVRTVGPFRDSIRPFTVNAAETLAYVTVDFLSGFEVADLESGEKLYTVEVAGFPLAREDHPELPVTQSHGIALTPDEREVWVVDDHYDHLHVFDVSGVPARPPRQVADIALGDSPKWINFSRDGRFAHVSTGEIVSTETREIVALVERSRQFVQVDFDGDRPVAAYSRYGLGYGD